MSTLDEADRREYYRIEDTIALEISPLSAHDATTTEVLRDESALFNLLSELHLSEFEAQRQLRQVNDQDRALAGYLKTLNKRVDLLSQVMSLTLLGSMGEPQEVTLSEGGIEFSHHLAFPTQAQLSIKMILMPQAAGLLLRAKVTHCTPQSFGTFRVGTEFESLTDAQRQLLARYILQKQAQQRRLTREKTNPGAS